MVSRKDVRLLWKPEKKTLVLYPGGIRYPFLPPLENRKFRALDFKKNSPSQSRSFGTFERKDAYNGRTKPVRSQRDTPI